MVKNLDSIPWVKDNGSLACKKRNKYKTKAWFGCKNGRRRWMMTGFSPCYINPVNGTSQSDVFYRMESMKFGPPILLRWENSQSGTKGSDICCLSSMFFRNLVGLKPLKDKRGESVTEAFKKYYRPTTSSLALTDKGSEFYNANVKRLLKEHNISLYSTENEEKSSVVERWNQTMKHRLWKMFSANNNTIYFDRLGKVVDEYNSRFHSSVKMTPVEASRKKNERKVFANLFGDLIYSKHVPPNFHVGENVRISKYKRKIFDKGFTPNWTEEIFVIDEILNTNPVTYKLVDLQGEKVTGSFYEQELQKSKQEIFRIEKIKRHDHKKKQALVKWKGYPDKFNSWLPLSELLWRVRILPVCLMIFACKMHLTISDWLKL